MSRAGRVAFRHPRQAVSWPGRFGQVIGQEYTDREAASRAAALVVASALQRRMRRQERAAAVIAGGSTPRACYRHLSGMRLEFSRINFVPSDERWLPGDAEDSNEHMIRTSLLGGAAAAADFMSFYQASTSASAVCELLEQRFRALPLPLAVTLLGIGDDGHFASLFPDLPAIADALDPQGGRCCVSGATAAGPHTRVSLTLSALTNSDEVLVLAFGDRKKRVIDEARAGDERYPLSALFAQTRAPVRVIWAP